MIKQTYNRSPLFDMMRCLGIFIIIFHHLPYYCFNFYNLSFLGINLNLSPLNELNRYLGLGLFVFISGYLTNLKKISFTDWDSVGKFLYKKMIRVFPLYYLALASFCYIYNTWKISTILIHGAGLQLILASKFQKPLPTLWFIGLIVIYYVLFSVINMNYLNQIYKMMILAGFPLLIFFTSFYLKFTDAKLFLYYFVFWFGIFCCHTQILETRIWKKILLMNSWMFFLILGFCFWWEQKQPMKIFDDFILINILMFSFVLFLYNFRDWLEGMNPQIHRGIQIISYASYGMFLFHRPVWFFMARFLKESLRIDNIYGVTILLIIVGIPAIFMVAFGLQWIYDRYSRWLG